MTIIFSSPTSLQYIYVTMQKISQTPNPTKEIKRNRLSSSLPCQRKNHNNVCSFLDFVSSIEEVHSIVLRSPYNDAAICMGAKRGCMHSYFHMNIVSLSAALYYHTKRATLKAPNPPLSSIKISIKCGVPISG